MLKVLSGEQYTLARMAGIMHEAYVARVGKLVPTGNVCMYGEGMITTNKLTGELGLIVNTESEWYGVPAVHEARFVEVKAKDGWREVEKVEDVGVVEEPIEE
jgi:hypothetical protein